MSQEIQSSPDVQSRKWRPALTWLLSIVAWLIIVGIAVLIAWPRAHDVEGQESPAAAMARLMTQQLQARYLVAAADFFQMNKSQFADAAQTLNVGPVDQRLRAVVVTGEVAGPKAAWEQLQELQSKIEAQGVVLTAEQSEV